MSGYEPDSNLKLIKEQKREIQTLIDQLVFAPSTNQTPAVHSNYGPQMTQFGWQTGLEANQSIQHILQDVVVPGVYDTIIPQSANMMINLTTSATLALKWIQGNFVDGAKFILQTIAGKTLSLEPGGSFLIPSAHAMTENDMVVVQYSKDQNGFKVLSGGSGGGGSTLWSDITIDVAKDMQGFGLLNLGFVAFDSTPTSLIDRSAGVGMRFFVPTGELFQYRINNVTEYEFTSTHLDMKANDIIGLDDITFNESGQFIISDSSGLSFLVPASDNFSWYVNGFLKLDLDSAGLNLSSIFLEFGNANRHIVHSSGLNYNVLIGESHKIQINSSTEYEFTSVHLDFNGNDILNLDDIAFAEAGQSLQSLTSGLRFGLPTGDTFDIYINAVQKMTLSAILMTLDVGIALNNKSITGIDFMSMNDSNMIINDASNIFSFQAGSGQNIQLSVGGVLMLSLNSAQTMLRSTSQVSLQVTGAGDTIVFNDGSSNRLTYDWSTDDFFPIDNQSSLGKSGARWTEVWAVNGTIQTSFTRFKRDITPVSPSECLAIVMSLPTIKYRMKYDDVEFKDPEKAKRLRDAIHFGFAADALETMMPEACSGDGVNMSSVTAACIGAIQDLQRQINELKDKLK